MSARSRRYKSKLSALACGGVSCGFIAGFGDIAWATVVVSILSIWLSALAQLLIQGSVDSSTLP